MSLSVFTTTTTTTSRTSGRNMAHTIQTGIVTTENALRVTDDSSTTDVIETDARLIEQQGISDHMHDAVIMAAKGTAIPADYPNSATAAAAAATTIHPTGEDDEQMTMRSTGTEFFSAISGAMQPLTTPTTGTTTKATAIATKQLSPPAREIIIMPQRYDCDSNDGTDQDGMLRLLGPFSGDLAFVPSNGRGQNGARASSTASMTTTASTTAQKRQQQQQQQQPLPHRAIHKIRLRNVAHNFSHTESVAARQHCSIIAVLKADGYGHGAIATALQLADMCGADAFAVATLEEAIALRKAFDRYPAGQWTYSQLKTTHGGGSTTSTGTSTAPLLSTVGTTSNVTSYPPASINGGAMTSCGNNSSDNLSILTGSALSTTTPRPIMTNFGCGYDSISAASSWRRPWCSLRPPHIRIWVLGSPVGYPRCFDDYYHYNIELMVSGPEVAAALMEWVADADARKRTQVERSAMEAKEQALSLPWSRPSVAAPAVAPATASLVRQALSVPPVPAPPQVLVMDATNATTSLSRITTPRSESPLLHDQHQHQQQQTQLKLPSSTLGNVSGQDLAKEVRTILLNQQAAMMEAAKLQQQRQLRQQQYITGSTGRSSTLGSTANSSCPSSSSSVRPSGATSPDATPSPQPQSPQQQSQHRKVFGGIEAAAQTSRARERFSAASRAQSSILLRTEDDNHNDKCDDFNCAVTSNSSSGTVVTTSSNINNTNANISSTPVSSIASNTGTCVQPPQPMPRKRLRWHALVDSGMGRLGFKTDPIKSDDTNDFRQQDTVKVIQSLVDAEFLLPTAAGTPAPIEFYGMCTHMADASTATSAYTQEQMDRFTALMERVRAVGIAIPTLSTDNSAALLSPTLNHFDPKQLLTQPLINTRGYARIGGALYGQRPAFPNLRAVSTLIASVQHVAIMKQGESVGYDRAFVAPYDCRIATLTIGFADGYPRELGNGIGCVAIRGAIFPIAGKVCMDLTMCLVGRARMDRNDNNNTSHTPNNDDDKIDNNIGAQVTVGDQAILWGPSDNDDDDNEGLVRLQDVAETLQTTQSALTCGITSRVAREYV